MAGPVLGIESSCDETAAAVLSPEGAVLAEALLSQSADHAPFGGVVPEIAARAHLAHLPDMVRGVLARAGVRAGELGGIAASAGPGLIGGLIVGSGVAKGMAMALKKPYVGVNHLEAHALVARLPGLTDQAVTFPYLLLLISGGHCQCVLVRGIGDYVRLGGTIDDAVGEAFDKVGKLLGLPWPGGPALEQLAATGRADAFAFPRPLLGRPGCDFSFSGLKTAVALVVARQPEGALAHQMAADIAASFQTAVADVLADRIGHAIAQARAIAPSVNLLVAAGGVASNAAIRAALSRTASEHRAEMFAPPPRLCTDNAVMVAWAGIERLGLGLADDLGLAPRPRWPLEELSRPPSPNPLPTAPEGAFAAPHPALAGGSREGGVPT